MQRERIGLGAFGETLEVVEAGGDEWPNLVYFPLDIQDAQ